VLLQHKNIVISTNGRDLIQQLLRISPAGRDDGCFALLHYNAKLTMKNITAFTLSLLLISNAFAGSPVKKITTTSYKDIATNITRTIGGIVPAAQESNISAQISAVIDHFHVDTGHEVKKGDLLVSLNCRENQLKLKQADANFKAEEVQLTHAKTKFNQAKKLNKQGNISKELYNQREADENRLKATLENKKAARSLAQLNVDRCQIKAPFNGYIIHRHASIGELTQVGTHLLQLISKTNNIVEVKINHGLFNSFSQGKNYRFIFNDKSYPLQLEFILPVLDSKTRNHITRLQFINKAAVTGSVGKVLWQEKTLSIPASYLVSRNNKLGLFVVENNTAKFIPIKNAHEGQPAMITLDEATQIINKGRFNVKHGDALKIMVNN